MRFYITATTWIFLLGSLSLLFPAPSAHAALTVTVTGDWRLGLTRQTLVGLPGSDLSTVFESAPGRASLTVSGALRADQRWRVEISRRDLRWHPALQLQVCRAGNGVGAGVVHGGLNYRSIDTIPGVLMSGCGNRLQVPLQFRLSGFSVRVPPADYTTELSYTVVDLQ
ncbi:MAG: hypothetical protein WCP21_17635 [Armatimonadota bacterium]